MLQKKFDMLSEELYPFPARCKYVQSKYFSVSYTLFKNTEKSSLEISLVFSLTPTFCTGFLLENLCYCFFTSSSQKGKSTLFVEITPITLNKMDLIFAYTHILCSNSSLRSFQSGIIIATKSQNCLE